MRIKVFRWRSGEELHRYDTFEVEVIPGMTVLSALFQIQERYDESLAFRYSCRGAVCGTCAMLINRIPRLACRTQIQSIISEIRASGSPEEQAEIPGTDEDGIIIEPLPHLPVIRDLIVDMEPFFRKIHDSGLVFRPGEADPPKERLMNQTEVHELEKYTNCILCGACYAACPNEEKNPDFLGPAALAKIYRFHIDPRESPGIGRLMSADTPTGWSGCSFHSRCRSVCPKGVTPDIAIGKARRELKKRTGSPGESIYHDTG